MGEIIEGPWRQREGRDLMHALSEQIARMTAALERLRDLHERGEALNLPAGVDAGRKLLRVLLDSASGSAIASHLRQ